VGHIPVNIPPREKLSAGKFTQEYSQDNFTPDIPPEIYPVKNYPREKFPWKIYREYFSPGHFTHKCQLNIEF